MVNQSLKFRFDTSIFLYFSAPIRQLLNNLPKELILTLEEIRLRQLRPLMICSAGQDFALKADGRVTKDIEKAYCVSKDDIIKTMQLITQSSIYAVEDELRNGYITLPGGHRVGIAGKAVIDSGKVKTFKYISSLNFRIAREIPGSADKILPFVINKSGEVANTLIISPPKAGKTTILRDLVRQLATPDVKKGFEGYKISLIDERSEIACCFEGVPQNDVGIKTDVLDGCPKAYGIMVMLRTMSPEIIACDEIGKQEDVDAIREVLNSGAAIIATAHGKHLDDIKKRPHMYELIHCNFFQRYIILGFSSGVGTLEQVVDGENFQIIYDSSKKIEVISSVL